jgi:coenzyme F420 hydrogenase subunit delta
MLYPEIVVVGCGNPLFGDDGFGPAVVEELQKLQLPDNVKVIDAGLGAPHFIFTLLDVETTRKLVIIDIADFGAEPGSVVILPVEALPPGSYRDVHSWDLTEPLHRLKDHVAITVIACQPGRVAEFEMELTEEVKRAIPKAVRIVLKEIGGPYGTAIDLQEEGGRGAEARGGAEESAGTGKTCSDVL